MTLQPCSQCRRHFGSDEAACPFCAAPRQPAPSRSSIAGRFSRAAVFAGVAGCYTNPPPQQPPPPPPPDNPDNSQFAQPPTAGTGSIHGTVADNGGAVARVGVQLDGAGVPSRRTTTDERGQYTFTNLPPGNYTITVDYHANPRSGPPRRAASVSDGGTAQIDFTIVPQPYDNSNIPKPYGAPPARHRVV